MAGHEVLVVLDCGGFGGESMARRVRGMGVYSVVLPCAAPFDRIAGQSPRGIILACPKRGADMSAGRKIAAGVCNLGVPILGVGGSAAQIASMNGCELTDFIDDYVISVCANDLLTEKIIRSFLFDKCGFSSDWNMNRFINESINDIKARVGEKKVLLALSGGVDSTVTAVLLNKAIGNQLNCVFVDHGFLRKGEAVTVEAMCKEQFGIKLTRIDARSRFLMRLAGVCDPEAKRKIIGEEFIRVFEEASKKIGDVSILAQGTIYPDVIESGAGESALVKTHHNVGGLPEKLGFTEIIEPLRLLFKDEVRQAGLELNIPPAFVWRQPFPGPGLAVRVLGEITEEKLSVVREADAIFREEIAAAGLEREISQYFAVLTDMHSVGVSGAGRSYEKVVALRAVQTGNFMTADFTRVPYDILERVSIRITSEIPRVNRVVYDITSKPPSTIEWE